MTAEIELNQRIFLMLIPEHPTYDMAKQFQEEVNEKYGLYRILPKLHITLESIYVESDDDIGRATWAIHQVCHKIKSFPIYVNGFACFGPPYKSVQFHVTKTAPLLDFYTTLHARLQGMGLKVKEYPEGVQFHMTIASAAFADREWTEEEYTQACSRLKHLPIHSGFVLKHLELWHPTLDENKKVLAKFWL